jgi:hypothetical protein
MKEYLLGPELLANALSLGGYGLVNRLVDGGFEERRQNFKDKADNADVPKWLSRGAPMLTELAAAPLGAANMITQGLSRIGMTGAKLALGSGSASGGLYSILASRDLEDVPLNAAVGSGLGALTGLGAHGVRRMLNSAELNRAKEAAVKAYQEVRANAIAGNPYDVMATMRVPGQAPINIQRGAAIRDAQGNLIVQGPELKIATGTEDNFGLTKIINKHGINKDEIAKLPYMLSDYRPIIDNRGSTWSVPIDKGKHYRIGVSKNWEGASSKEFFSLKKGYATADRVVSAPLGASHNTNVGRANPTVNENFLVTMHPRETLRNTSLSPAAFTQLLLNPTWDD